MSCSSAACFLPDPGRLAFQLLGVAPGVGQRVGAAEEAAALRGEGTEGTESLAGGGKLVPGVPGGVEPGGGFGGEPLDFGLPVPAGGDFLFHHFTAFLEGGFGGDVLFQGLAQPDEFVGQEAGLGVADLELHGLCPAGHLCLLAEGRQLPADFGGEVAQPLQVGLHGLEFADGLFLASPVLEDPGGLFDEAAAVFRGGVQDAVQLALADDHVHFAAQPGIGEQFLDVQEPAGRAVDGIFGAAGPEQRAGNGDFAVLDGQRAVGVVDGERDVCPAERRAPCRSGEDDVFHFAAAQGLGALFTHHPGKGVDDIGLPGPVGANHRGDAGFEVERRGRRERLESPDSQTFQMQGGSELLQWRANLDSGIAFPWPRLMS